MAALIDPLSRPVDTYRIPGLLQDIRLLDLLELSGSTVQASRLLNLSQPTVSRRYRVLAQDFGLKQEPRDLKRCCYGSTEAMRWLRLGCRAHRLAAGVARIGADLMHQPLLAGGAGLLPVPVRFRSIHSWATLVREGVLDGALVSGLELTFARQQLELSGLQWLELEELPIALGVHRTVMGLASGAGVRPVLVPLRAVAPGLHRTLHAHDLALQAAGRSCTGTEQWLERLANHQLAIPIYQDPASQAFWGASINLLHPPAGIQASVGLLLPDDAETKALAVQAWERAREQSHRQLARASSGGVCALSHEQTLRPSLRG